MFAGLLFRPHDFQINETWYIGESNYYRAITGRIYYLSDIGVRDLHPSNTVQIHVMSVTYIDDSWASGDVTPLL